MPSQKDWFKVDPEGLRQLLSRKDPAFLLHELLQNAWDEETSKVEIEILGVGRNIGLRITDDNPDGFKNLDEAHTLFAPSAKKNDPEKRGRFNLGEKLVLACCKEARITSTTGSVIFNGKGRRRSRNRRETGTEFEGWLKPGTATADQLRDSAQRIIPPVKTFIDGVEIKAPLTTGKVRTTLATVVANANGELRNSQRITEITLHETADEGWLFEMGLPVCPAGTPFHMNVHQKIPLGFDRESTRESYLLAIRAACLNTAITSLTPTQAKETWVTKALEHANCTRETTRKAIDLKFGERTAIWDVKDPEANKRATAAGYVVISGGTFGKNAWEKIRESEASVPAGKLFPTPQPHHPDGKQLNVIQPEDYTVVERHSIRAITTIAERLVGHKVNIVLADDPVWPFVATYGPLGVLTLNRPKIGANLVVPLPVEILDLLIHELGHEKEGDHLSEKYYKALTRYGAELALMLRAEPDLIGSE